MARWVVRRAGRHPRLPRPPRCALPPRSLRGPQISRQSRWVSLPPPAPEPELGLLVGSLPWQMFPRSPPVCAPRAHIEILDSSGHRIPERTLGLPEQSHEPGHRQGQDCRLLHWPGLAPPPAPEQQGPGRTVWAQLACPCLEHWIRARSGTKGPAAFPLRPCIPTALSLTAQKGASSRSQQGAQEPAL